MKARGSKTRELETLFLLPCWGPQCHSRLLLKGLSPRRAAFVWKMECNPLPPWHLPRAENWMDTSQTPSSPSFRREEIGRSQRWVLTSLIVLGWGGGDCLVRCWMFGRTLAPTQGPRWESSKLSPHVPSCLLGGKSPLVGNLGGSCWSPGDGGSPLPAMMGGMEGVGEVGGVYNRGNWTQRMRCENSPSQVSRPPGVRTPGSFGCTGTDRCFKNMPGPNVFFFGSMWLIAEENSTHLPRHPARARGYN